MIELRALGEAVAHVAETTVCPCGNACGPEDFDADPYAYDIHNDDTKMWECDYCRYQSAMDI